MWNWTIWGIGIPKYNLNNVDNYLKIHNEEVEIKIKNQIKKINGKLIKTDLYTIINNVLSYIINDENNIYLHSVVVSNENNGILILGSFGQGKTTLANEFSKNKFEINSTDQTWLKIQDGNLIQVLGSKFYIDNSDVRYLKDEDSKRNVKIDKIIRLIGLCDKGDLSINKTNDLYKKIKQISDYASWSVNSPLFTDDTELYNVNKSLKKFLIKLDKIPLYNVRGDKEEVVKKYK